ncbi:hypothetical protein [Flammeovirga pacifica]|uniref:Uncharacterized protein n=1 Tax=Flammeovirga pacifica TaxID=915059 RepID=A0A1S1Z2S5_FLAPC|nr:hypothetical protein [Flammeovirga pacifica]OHX67586.1 hypothetical protein NH26_15125 [Flammeovirga pacifica]
MKKTILIIASSALILSMVSCSKNNDPEPANQKPKVESLAVVAQAGEDSTKTNPQVQTAETTTDKE